MAHQSYQGLAHHDFGVYGSMAAHGPDIVLDTGFPLSVPCSLTVLPRIC